MQGWFVRNLQIIGEAAQTFPEDMRALARRSNGPRSSACATCSFTGISAIDTAIVWEAASRDALALKPRIEELLQRLEGHA